MSQPLAEKVVWIVAIVIISLTAACTQKHHYLVQEDTIVLYYHDISANEVVLASSIDLFQLHPATMLEDGTWKVTVPKKDEFSYFFLVDKIPTIPECEFTVVDDFGAKNCFFALDM